MIKTCKQAIESICLKTQQYLQEQNTLNMQLEIIIQPLDMYFLGQIYEIHMKIGTQIFEIQIERRQKALPG